MQRNQLSDISIFVEVARTKGFRAAAKKLGLGSGSVSEAVQRFEDRLGARLFDRTTRKIALTSAGQHLYERSLAAIIDLEEAVRGLDELRNVVSGTLRLNAPPGSGSFFLDELISQYAESYPDVAIELMYDEEKVDLVTAGIDAAIRAQTLLEQDTHAVAIGPKLQMVIVGSPDYFNRKGLPKTPADLTHHDGICFAFGNSHQMAPWNFTGPQGTYSLLPNKRLIVNDLHSMLRFAERGLGVAYLYAKSADPLLQSGKLVPVLQQSLAPFPRFTINYLSKRNMPNRLRAFIDMAKRIE